MPKHSGDSRRKSKPKKNDALPLEDDFELLGDEFDMPDAIEPNADGAVLDIDAEDLSDLDKTHVDLPPVSLDADDTAGGKRASSGKRSRKDDPLKPHSIFKKRTKPPSFALCVAVTAVKLTAVLLVCACLAGVGAIIGIAKAYVDTAPTLDLAALDSQDKTSFIYDSNGSLITDYKGTEDRVMVSIDEIPVMLRNAFIAVEDARFYEHNGVDVKRIVGALITNVTTGSQQGGSTITQQLIKQTVLSSESSYKRKLQEAYLAMELETRYTKDQILEATRTRYSMAAAIKA